MSKPRNYKKEYKATHGTKNGKLDRAKRNQAYLLMKPGKGKVVHHKNGNPRDNRPSNLSVRSKKANRKEQPKRKA